MARRVKVEGDLFHGRVPDAEDDLCACGIPNCQDVDDEERDA